MDICVDKRTEIISIILALSQGNEYVEEHFSFDIEDEYRKKTYVYFNKFINHKCIKQAKKIAKTDFGFNYDNPIRLAYCLDENLHFNGKIENYLINELENINLIKEFLSEIHNFATESCFDDFYNDNLSYYNDKIEQIKKIINLDDFVSVFKNFLKKDIKDDFKINIIPMLTNANHGFTINDCNIANIGLLSEDFTTIEPFNNGYKHIIIHEFCHCYVNCYTNGAFLKLPELFKNEITKRGYGNPSVYLNDTIVRAMTIRLREKVDNIDVKKFLDLERKFNFVFVEDVYQNLIKYEKQNLPWEIYIEKILLSITKKTANFEH